MKRFILYCASFTAPKTLVLGKFPLNLFKRSKIDLFNLKSFILLPARDLFYEKNNKMWPTFMLFQESSTKSFRETRKQNILSSLY